MPQSRFWRWINQFRSAGKANRLVSSSRSRRATPHLELLEDRLTPAAPVVTSILRQAPSVSPTNVNSVTYAVTFDQTVTGVNAADFAVTTTNGMTFTSPFTTGGSLANYTVTITGINASAGNGNLRLDLVDDNSIRNAGLETLGGPALADGNFTGQAYDIDQIGPRVASIVRQTPAANPTNANAVTFRVTFSEDVQNVGTTDFSASTGTVGTVAVIDGRTYDVPVTGLNAFTGTVTLSFAAAQNIKDPAGNLLSNTAPTGTNNNTFIIDHIAPRIVNIARLNPASSPTSGGAVTFRVTFDEDVQNLDRDDFSVNSGTLGITSQVDGETYDIPVTDLGGFDGTLTLSFAIGQNIADLVGNPLGNLTPTGTNNNTYIVDHGPPEVTSIERLTPSTTPTNASAVTYRVTFSEDVQNVNTADFSVNTGTLGAVVQISPSTYNVPVSGLGAFNGTLTLSFAAGQNILDLANNALSSTAPTGTNDNTYAFDHVVPRIASIVRQTPTTSPTNADDVTFRVTFSEAMINVDASDFAVNTGTVGTVVAQSALIYDVPVSDLSAFTGTLTLTMAAGRDFQDPAGNLVSNTSPTGTNNNTFVLDHTAPRVASITRRTPPTATTNGSAVTYRVTFSEDVQNVNAADFSVNAGTLGTIVPVNANTYDVPVSGLGAFDGALTLSFAGAQDIQDLVGNSLANTTPTGTNNNTYTIDHGDPRVASIARQSPTVSPTNANSVTFRVTFSENVFNVDATDFSVNVGTLGTVSQVNAKTYDVPVTGLSAINGTLTLSFAAGRDLVDQADNTLANTTPTGTNNNTYLLDHVVPTVTSIVRQVPTISPTNADAVTYRVTFSEPMINVDASDFLVTAGTLGTVNSIDAQTYDVPVTGLNAFTGTLTLSFAAGRDIQDPSGNLIANPTPTGTNNPTYAVDHTFPFVQSITLLNAPAGNTTSLTYQVDFNETVTGVTAANFTVALTGVLATTPPVVVTPISGSRYNITINGIAGNGNIAPVVVDTGAIRDLASNPLKQEDLVTVVTISSPSPTIRAADLNGDGVFDLYFVDGPGTIPSNLVQGAAQGAFFAIDQTKPSLVITPKNIVTNSATTTFSFSFNEAVTGFDANDVVVTNGSKGTFTPLAGGKVYTLVVTPTADGTVSVSVNGNAGFDAATNGNTAATTASITSDRTGPTFTSLAAFNFAENSTATLAMTATDPRGPVIFSLGSGQDVARFTMTSSGVLAFRAPPNFEAANDGGTDNIYNVPVIVSDFLGNQTTRTVAVTVTNVNEKPTASALNNQSLPENAGINFAIGDFSTTDPDAANTFIYSLVTGSGSTDNGLFNISGTTLRASNSLNFETAGTRTIRVRTTDQGSLTFERSFVITVTNLNETPTSLALSNATLRERAGDNAILGILSTGDPDANDPHSYTLVNGTGDANNALFTISGQTLLARNSLDFETQPSLSVRVRSTDSGGFPIESFFTITVTNVNETPTNVLLSNHTILENLPAGSTVGDFSTTDPDSTSTFTYTLVAGAGATDNAAFQLTPAGRLSSSRKLDFETKSTLSIQVRSTDQGGLSIDRTFTIFVLDVREDGIIARNAATGEIKVANSAFKVTDTNAREFVSSVWGKFPPTVTNIVDFLTGDFNADGRDDFAARDAATGKWYVGLATQFSSFTVTSWGVAWAFGAGVTWADVQVGDLDGDGDADILGRRLQTGELQAAISTGTTFTIQSWGFWSPQIAWVNVFVGDFDGDVRADVAGRNSVTGNWQVTQSLATGNVTSAWGNLPATQNVTYVDFLIGDLNGDGKKDLISRNLQSGQWTANISTGTAFSNVAWTPWSTSPLITWVDVKLGDFDGDGRDDLVGRNHQSGQWWVSYSKATGIVTQSFGVWTETSSVTWVDTQIGDFDGDGKMDIASRWLQTGLWYVGLSRPNGMLTQLWGQWEKDISWLNTDSGAF